MGEKEGTFSHYDNLTLLAPASEIKTRGVGSSEKVRM